MKPTRRAVPATIASVVAVLAAAGPLGARADAPKPAATHGSAAAQGVAGPGVPTAGADSALGRRADHGIALALGGELRAAEAAFTSLLAAAPGDPRALANLGNVRALNGDLEVALAFYDQALRAAPRQAGIVLNRATVLLLLGETDRAELEAARGIELAGGEAEAATLLGLPSARGVVTARASEPRFVSREEIRALLTAARARVPGDSMRAAAPDSARHRARRPSRTWRSAGPRAGDRGDLAAVLCWMR